MPPLPVNYHAALAEATAGRPFRADLKRIDITQPDGPSFSVSGSLVTWQKWRLRVLFSPRTGLELADVGWQDSPEGPVRPVLHRIALVEMAVPYADPR